MNSFKTSKTEIMLKLKVIFILLFTALIGASCSKDDDNGSKTDNLPNISGYPVVSTNQELFFDNTTTVTAPVPEQLQ